MAKLGHRRKKNIIDVTCKIYAIGEDFTANAAKEKIVSYRRRGGYTTALATHSSQLAWVFKQSKEIRAVGHDTHLNVTIWRRVL
tara:strand:+ start:238 stop:489 length:252 start_codon:yes stop_codon:yes gene_type:complete